MTEEPEQQLKDLLRVESRERDASQRVAKAMSKVRAGVGARDALLFAAVRIWTVVARLLAPVFARLAVRKAELDAGRRPSETRQSDSE